MQIVARVVGAIVGIVLSFPAGQSVGCRVYEASGPDYAQCGYEFEGIEHVLLSIVVLALILAFFGQWFAGWLWRRFSDRDR